jgi:hypothetical protein
VNEKREFLLQRLDDSIALLASLRTSEPLCTAAFDTLKQARALTARAFATETHSVQHRESPAAGVN